MDKLHTAWQALLADLETRAPETRRALRPATDPAPDAEERLGRPLTDELRSWFGLHGGVDEMFRGQIFPFNTPIDLDSAVEVTLMARKIWRDVRGDLDADRLMGEAPGTAAFTWLNAYVMIAQDGMGGGLFADLRPGPLQGCVRWWDKVDADCFDPLADGVADLLTIVTRSLRTGEPVDGWEPQIVDGVLDWMA